MTLALLTRYSLSQFNGSIISEIIIIYHKLLIQHFPLFHLQKRLLQQLLGHCWTHQIVKEFHYLSKRY